METVIPHFTNLSDLGRWIKARDAERRRELGLPPCRDCAERLANYEPIAESPVGVPRTEGDAVQDQGSPDTGQMQESTP
jgi:hypothetical protein